MKIKAPEHDASIKQGKFPEPSPAASGKRKLAEIAAEEETNWPAGFTKGLSTKFQQEQPALASRFQTVKAINRGLTPQTSSAYKQNEVSISRIKELAVPALVIR